MTDDEEREKQERPTSDEETAPTPQKTGKADHLDRAFRILAATRRRSILYYLQEEGACDVDDIAQYIAESNGVTSPRDEPSLQQAKSHLFHTDLPKLLDTGFVEYTERTGRVRFSNPPAYVEDLLDVLSTLDKPKSH